MKSIKKLLMFVAIAIVAASCGGNGTANFGSEETRALSDQEAKYVFYFIGDGMAATQVQLAEAALTVPKFRENYAKQTSSSTMSEGLQLKSLGVTGLATSNASNRYITDSAAAGTALATGSKTNVGVISLDTEGNVLETIAEKAKKKGMKVGIVSSVSIDHATPASFYSHVESRGKYAEISDQLLTSGFDYFAGGSVKWSSRASAEKCDKPAAYASYRAKAEDKGYKFVATKSDFDKIGEGEFQPVIATLNMLAEHQYSGDGYALPYTIDLSKEESEDNKITLAQFTQKGIDLLDNKDGFFMMVEGGKIDWACHANDAATCAYEVVAFDEAIGVALEFAKQHPKETLIVVTGDHDCGGLTLGFAGTGYESAFDILASSTSSYQLFARGAVKKIASGQSFDSLLKYACEEFGFTNNETGDASLSVAQTLELSDFEIKLLRSAYAKSVKKVKNMEDDDVDQYFKTYGGNDPFTVTCTNLINNKAGIEFASFSHTAVPVMVFADGVNSNIFSGYYDNTDIPKKIIEAAGL